MRFFITLSLVVVSSVVFAQQDQEFYKELHSAFDELNPVVSPDGSTLYLTIANHPDNMGGKSDPGDIWISTFDGLAWSSPKHGGSVINDRAYNAVAGVNDKGDVLFLFNHFAEGSTAKTQGISQSKVTSNGFERPENIYIPYFHSKSTLITGSLSADNRVLLYSAESYGSYGVEDIYVTVKHQGKWSEPKNLGPVINSAFQELTPWLSADGKTLYFSSNGRDGYGSFDVYSSSRLDDSWTSWSEPVNIGSEVNTVGRELFFQKINGNVSLLTSTTNSDGYGDVRFIKPAAVVPVAQVFMADADTTEVAAPVLATEIKKPSKLFGKILNSKTGELITAKVEVSLDREPKAVALASESGYEVLLNDTGTYAVLVVAPGFISVREKIDLHASESLEFNFTLQPAEEGTTVNLKNVLFAQGKPDLLPDSYDELDLVTSFLKENPNVKIELSGHTDNRGVHADNVRLSQERVNTVKAYLVSKGVEGKRISGKGYGGTKPIASNETEETRKMNRRVEFTIKKS